MARKAPLVASDSSSSNSSDSDDEEAKKDPSSGQTVTTETVSTVAGKETIRLTVDTKNERAVFSRYTHTHTNCDVQLVDKGLFLFHFQVYL